MSKPEMVPAPQAVNSASSEAHLPDLMDVPAAPDVPDGKPATVPPAHVFDVAASNAQLPDPFDVAEMSGMPAVPAGNGPRSPPPLPFGDLDLPTEAQADLESNAEYLPDFILDGF